jgi:hypothetical protein
MKVRSIVGLYVRKKDAPWYGKPAALTTCLGSDRISIYGCPLAAR